MKTKNELISELIQNYGDDVTSTEIRAYCVMKGMTFNDVVSQIEEHKVSNSKWNLNSVPEKNIPVENAIPDRGYIPAKNPNYVPFGNFSDIKKIITSGIFYPFFITGLSGNGKTMSVEQACAVLKRSMILFPVTIETDEDDLIGGFRLVNGETVFHYGPVVEAMKTGSILLLDEIDYASNKISCIQSVLAGNPLYLKKTGETIYPKKGFNIIATAN
ncbi:MAG: MoxR family ATPase, partial [Spirochaetia bacterium]|nr:MoxR family ATPase [Spirochaetia bacterium]